MKKRFFSVFTLFFVSVGGAMLGVVLTLAVFYLFALLTKARLNETGLVAILWSPVGGVLGGALSLVMFCRLKSKDS